MMVNWVLAERFLGNYLFFYIVILFIVDYLWLVARLLFIVHTEFAYPLVPHPLAYTRIEDLLPPHRLTAYARKLATMPSP